MMDAAQRAPIRRWLYAAYIAMWSAEFGVHHATICCAMATSGFARARIRFGAARLDSCREPVALILDNQQGSYATCVFEKSRGTGCFRLVVQRQAYGRRPQPMWAAAVRPPVRPPSEQALPVDARTTGFCFEVTAEIWLGIRSVYLTIEELPRSARPRCGQRMRGIGDAAALRQLYRRWFASDRS